MISSVYQIVLAQLGGRVWAAHVESKSNCSDGVSRASLEDPLLGELGRDKVHFDFPPINNLYMLLLEALIGAFGM